ncbi:31025_t:CDS:2 [Gigaspora margarita]|uniref:31025_t:CDS:1 n=1 Tax=Gigaspora margarita TaxID=4874 RepID=A0ABM8VYY4_GIGMA|nr:31025_t:CDS:2 [Gigaspora margarita]
MNTWPQTTSNTFQNEKNCTAAFIGNKQGIDGFITSALCCARDNCNIFRNEDSDVVYEGNNTLNLIGGVYEIMFNLGYVFVTISTDWNYIPYTLGSRNELWPITSYLTLNETGQEVCAYGAKSGFFCGTLDEINVNMAILNPFTDRLDTLNVSKVKLGEKGFESFEDMGGPVYKRIDNNGNTTAQALGIITSFSTDNNTGHQYFYYTPIETILSAGIINLITPSGPI